MQQTNYIGETEPPDRSARLDAKDLRVLVMLKEPASRQKLLLRAEIEKELVGFGRERLMRNLIPVVEHDQFRSEQLIDDIIYLRDNFGGIGLWPLSFAMAEDDAAFSTTTNRILHNHLDAAEIDRGVLAKLIDRICPNRSWLRLLAWGSLILAFVAGVTLTRYRDSGTRLDNNKVFMAVIAILIMLPFLMIATLVVADPLFKGENGVHWIIAVSLLLGAIFVGAYSQRKPEREVP